jgi:hypothetical protein
MPLSRAFISIAISLLSIAAGCGPSLPERGVVRGVVTSAGKPVTQGYIRFLPESGRAAVGEISPDGSYQLTTFEPGDGALLGKHKVTIEAKKVISSGETPHSIDEEIAMSRDGRLQKAKQQMVWLAPARYSRVETSGLKAEVKPGENRIDFPLLGN